MNSEFKIFLLAAVAFFSGAVMYSYLLPKYIKKIDPREGTYDRNPGASNAMKACGTIIGLVCIFLDVAKAFIPVYISIIVFKISDLALVPIAVAPVLGHAFSPFLKFKGGKAVASSLGSFLALYPVSNLIIIFILTTIFFKYVITVKPNSSMMPTSLIGLDIYAFLSRAGISIKIITLIISLTVIYKHLLHPDEKETTAAIFGKYFKIRFHISGFNLK